MKIAELQLELQKRLLSACHQHLEFLKSDLSGKTLSSYTFLCSGGFRNISIASCTTEKIEELKSKNNTPAHFLELDMSEWDYFNTYYETFSPVDEFVDELYLVFYDGHLEDVNLDGFSTDELWEFISNFFEITFLEIFEQLKKLNFFNTFVFNNDVFKGIQVTDPDIHMKAAIERISAALNNHSWHMKLLSNRK